MLADKPREVETFPGFPSVAGPAQKTAAQNLRSWKWKSSINCAVAFSISRKTTVFRAGMSPAWMVSQPTDSTRVLFRDKAKPTIQLQQEYSMKMKNLLTVCGVAAALMFSAGSIYAQNNGGGGGFGGGNGGGGGGGGGFGGGGFRNMDPAQRQQFIMNGIRDQLGFTNDTEWSAVQPLVQKVVDARTAVGFGGGMRGMFGRNRGGGQGGGGGGNNPFNQPNPQRDALQQALDDNAPSSQVKDLLAKYEASQKDKQAKLKAAQDDLRKVLSVQQEASATLAGLLD